MTDGERLTAILAQYAIPCEKVSFHGKLDALAAGLGIQTQGRLMGDVLDDIAAKTGVKRDDRLYGTFIRKLYEDVTSGEDATLSGNPLTLTECIGGKPLGALHMYGKSTRNGGGHGVGRREQFADAANAERTVRHPGCIQRQLHG